MVTFKVKKENCIRKFRYRVVQKQTTSVTGETHKCNCFAVQRKTLLLGIGFWWTTSWEWFCDDNTNRNSVTYETREEAIIQMEAEQALRRFKRFKVISI